MRRDFLKILLVIIFEFNKLPCINSLEVSCPGKDQGEYCDCTGDCENQPDFCDCEEAKICCGNMNPSPTNPSPTNPSPTNPSPSNPSPSNPTPSPMSQPEPFIPIYKDGTGFYKNCKKTTQVFAVTICYTQKAWDNGDKKKIDHIAHVLAQYIDNNADGKIDDPDLISYMVNNDIFLFVPYDANDSEQAPMPDEGEGQMTGLWEAAVNSCNVPSNRGASDTDRSTWSSAVENTPGPTQCNPERDATVEEIHHLLAAAASRLYPDEWGATSSSKAGSLVLALNGNCGWGNKWTNPGGENPKCTGTYAYNDATCTEDCRVIEGIYWASVSWIGGLCTSAYASDNGNEWLMTVPDSSMAALPKKYKNAVTLEEGSPDLYKFISDTTSKKHLWLPRIMPNGVYTPSDTGPTPNPTSPTTAAPGPTPNPTNNDEDNDEDCEEDKATTFIYKYNKKKDKDIMKTCRWLQKKGKKKQRKICKRINDARDECPVTCKAC